MSEAELAQRLLALERRVARLEGREGLTASEPITETGFGAPPGEVSDDEIVVLLQQNKKIHAIKRYRELTGADLGDAKVAVDRIEAQYLAGG